MAIIAMQDVLGLDGQHRMNLPGTADGNWSWRMTPGMLTRERSAWLKGLADRYKR